MRVALRRACAAGCCAASVAAPGGMTYVHVLWKKTSELLSLFSAVGAHQAAICAVRLAADGAVPAAAVPIRVFASAREQ